MGFFQLGLQSDNCIVFDQMNVECLEKKILNPDCCQVVKLQLKTGC